MSSNIIYYFDRLREEKRPFRFLISRLLRKSRLSTLLLIKRNGYTLRFHPTALSTTLWLNPNERMEDEDFITRYLKIGDKFIDIGANIGTLTLTGARAVGSTGHVYAFEAHPTTARYLKSNIELNSFDHITLFDIALSDKRGDVGFSSLSSDDQNCVEEAGASIKVKALPLDDAQVPSQEIALLKIDVEGYEKFVLIGAEKTLPSVKAIYFEASEATYGRFGYDFSDIHNLLSRQGFTLLRWIQDRAELVSSEYCCVNTENILAVRDLRDFVSRMNVAAVCDNKP